MSAWTVERPFCRINDYTYSGNVGKIISRFVQLKSITPVKLL